MRDWAIDMARRRDLPPAWVMAALAPARRLPAVQRLIMPPPPGVAKNWAAYRARFIEPERIAAGVAFARAHEPWLRQAEERYGVPPAMVLGIIGVETFYGRVMGSFRVLDALATLAFDFPSGRSDRSPFFRDELEQLLVWSHRERIEPVSVLGSYAGA
ncbi:MAG: lytic transglycosylase domain-containing protein, partial [Aquabacterium sp.]